MSARHRCINCGDLMGSDDGPYYECRFCRPRPTPRPEANHTPAAETVLQEAERLTSTDRNTAYGHPLDDFDALGRMWGAVLTRHLGQPVPDLPAEVCQLMMVCVKVNREAHHPKRDNLVDGAGYFRLVERTHRKREDRKREGR